jgi:hypothetical protein
MRPRVCITVDTEFSLSGSLEDRSWQPIAEPMVWCDVEGQSEGLGFLLAQFARFHVPVTFFVETLHRHYFKHDPMRPIVRRIQDDGHEIQLHAHPCWSVFQSSDWEARVRNQPNQDDFYGRSEADSLRLIQQGIDTFDEWGLPRPSVFRSGNLQHDDLLYQALAKARIPYSSNVGLAIFDSCDPNYRIYAGSHLRHGVLECPVLTFCDWKIGGHRHLKTLTISGTSFAETCTLLDRAALAQVPLVVILTHPCEFVSRDSRKVRVRRHAVNQRRLAALCEFLDQNRGRFEPACLAGAAANAAAIGSSGNPLFEGQLLQSISRMATQVSYDCFNSLALKCKRN